MARALDLDELVEHWTLLDDERELIAGKRGPTRLGFALLLKFYIRAGRFPRGRGELPDDAVDSVARQVGVGAGELGFCVRMAPRVDVCYRSVRAGRILAVMSRR